MAVLRGAVQTLRHYQPVVMIELLHDLTAREAACRFMWDLGYRCHGIVNAPVLTLRELSELSSVQSFDDINFLFLPLQSVNSAS